MAKQIKGGLREGHKEVHEKTRSSDNELPIFLFDWIDRNGRFAFDINRKDFEPLLILDKIISYSKMTWREISMETRDSGHSKNHFLDYAGLAKEAKDRLASMEREDYADYIYSLSFGNLKRLVGIRDQNKFHILWYDSNHEIYPVEK